MNRVITNLAAMKNANGNLNGASVIAPLLIGLTLGAVAGILLAPESGSALRKRIRRAENEVEEKFNTGLKYAHSIAEDAEDFAYKHYNELTQIPLKKNVAELASLVAVAGVILGALFGTDKFKQASRNMMAEVSGQGKSLKHMLIHKN